MSISQGLLPEFDQEMAGTRRVLERVPEGKSDWKPHAKSMTLGRLASHLAELPGWALLTLEATELDVAPPGQPPAKPATLDSTADILALFDRNCAAARKAIAAAADPDWIVSWTLKKGGTSLRSMPRAGVMRSMVINHMIHHRAQLGVYLRLLDVAVPGTYGPTADER